MKTETHAKDTDTKPSGKTSRVAALQSQIDERDETIRLLNEALSVALDELNGVRKAA